MKTGKQIIAVLAAAMIFTGCGAKESADYYNYTGTSGYKWFTRGDLIYIGSTFVAPSQYHAGFDAPLEGLCRDPLCTHSGDEITCSDHEGFRLFKEYLTDGEKIYFMAFQWDMKFGIYSVNPDGTGLHMLTEYDGSDFHTIDMVYDDGYLYYQQTVYAEETGGKPIAVMRISTDGGTPEEFLPMRFQNSIAHYVDAAYYYILDSSPYYDYDQNLTLIDRKTGEIIENVRPEGYGVESVQVYRDETYIICAERIPEKDYETVTRVTPLRAYRFSDGKYELLAENIIEYAFSDGAFWYTPCEVEYYGTIMSPTGKGNETVPHDIIRNSGNTLMRVDLSDGSAKSWTFGRFDEGFTPTFYGISDGAAIVRMSSQKLYYETRDNGEAMHKYRLNDDGTVTDLGVFES